MTANKWDGLKEYFFGWLIYRWRLLVAVVVWFAPSVILSITAPSGLSKLLWLLTGLSLVPFIAICRYIDSNHPAFSPLATYGDPPGSSAIETESIDRYAVHVGTTVQDAMPVIVSPRGHSGILITGMPGSGKTVLMKYFLAVLRRNGADLTILDMKNGGDFRTFYSAGVPVFGGDLKDAVAVLEHTVITMRERQAVLGSAPEGVPNNYWNRSYEDRPPLLVIAIDEVQDLLEVDGVSKEEKVLMERASAALRQLVKLGRSAGVLVVAATQKSDGKAIPTSFRDQMSIRISGRQNTPEAARAALGALRDEDPRPDDFTVLPPDVPGRFVLAGLYARAVVFQGVYVEDFGLSQLLRG